MNNNPTTCAWCHELLPCNCGYGKPELDTLDWEKVARVFGKQGMPSCGATDAGKFNSDGEQTRTIYLGKEKTR